MRAYLLYTQAVEFEPKNSQFIARKNALQVWAALAGHAISGTEAISGNDPDEYAGIGADRIALEGLSPSEALESQMSAAAPHLNISTERKNFDLRGTARTLFEQVAGAYGIQLEFESGYQPPVGTITFRVVDVSMEEALRMMEAISGTFIVPINGKLALVYQDTAQRRTDSSPVITAVLPMPERMSVQEAQEIVQAVQQTMDIKKVGTDAGRRVLILRDQVSKVMAARQILAQLSRLRAQVEVDVDLLSVDRNSSLSYGLSLPNAATIVNLGKSFNNTALSISGLTKLATFGGGITFLGMGISDAMAMETVTKSSAKTMFHSQVVAVDGQQVMLHVGDSYPIITSGFVGNTPTAGNVGGFTAPPAIQFKDLGLVVQITPAIHEDHEVTLDVDAEFSALGATSNNGIPVISSRKFTGKVRLADGEWAVIAGLAVTQASETRSGIWGLRSIPWLGHLFESRTVMHDAQQTLILLKPRLTNAGPWEYASRALWVGSDSRPLTMY